MNLSYCLSFYFGFKIYDHGGKKEYPIALLSAVSSIIYFSLSLNCHFSSRSLHNMRMLNRAHGLPRFPPYV